MIFRRICKEMGADVMVTEFVSAEGIMQADERTGKYTEFDEGQRPVGVQLFGADGERMGEAARKIIDKGLAGRIPDFIDINFGCPVNKVVSRNGGSSLLRDCPLLASVASGVAKAVGMDVPVTAKLRLGWDNSSIVAPYMAKRLEEVGVKLITIHGRTREMGFGGSVRLDGIAEVVASVTRIPVIGNGDIRTPQDAAKMMQKTGCDGVMIGRAALSSPWIFRDTWSHFAGEIAAETSLSEKCQILRDHFHLLLQQRGEHSAIAAFRQRISWYAKQMQPCKALRDAMHNMKTTADFDGAIEDFLASRLSHETHITA